MKYKMSAIIILLLFSGAVFAQSANIVNGSGTTKDVYASSAYKVYADSFGLNPDLALRLCAVGQKYVAATYSANMGGTYNFTAISWNLTTGSDKTVVYTSSNMGGGCYQTPVDSYGFSQFKDNSRTPPVYVSAFPGRIHVLYSDNSDGSTPSFIGVPFANGYLRGNYTVTRAFDHTINRVNATVTAISFETDTGTISRAPSDPDWGLNASTGRNMVIALCTDDLGDTCSDSRIVNSTSQFPVQLGMGAVTINDQNTYNRNVVVDGLGFPICIGSDISAGIAAVAPSPLYRNGVVNVTVTVTNSGNVNVTTDFVLALNITGPGGYTNNTQWTITENLLPGQSTNRNYSWAVNGPTGTYTLTGRADQGNALSECSKANNNASTSVSSSSFYVMNILIDGNATNVFQYWGRPYNVTIWLTDSDNNSVANPKYVLTETNGLNMFTPTQVWNGAGLKGYNVGEMVGNSSGYIKIAVVPTCNELFTTHPNKTAIIGAVGNYSVKVNAYNNATGTPYILLYNGTMGYDMPLLVANLTCVDPGWVNNKPIVNRNMYFMDVYNYIYKVYSITKKLVAP
ncbi:MAG: CARDB domain-containing protein [Candidatus Micrarchaeota archaeon]